ncbi:MAG: hypothetical protein AB7I04_24055 [Pseudomonadales bacterium]
MIAVHIGLAVLAALAGLWLLFAAWRQRHGAVGYRVPLGWSLIVVSGGFWVSGSGAEFGVSLVLLATGAMAWLYVLANLEQRPPRIRGETNTPKPPAGPRTLRRHALLLLLVVPVAAIAATFVSVALSMALPVSEVDAMVVVLVVMPVLWGCAAFWAVADSRTARPALAMALGTIVSAAVIYL